MITIQRVSSFNFLLKKLSIRMFFVFAVLGLLFLSAKSILGIPFTRSFFYVVTISYVYIIFWFTLCFFVILFNKSSSLNAIILLTSWLLLVVFLPVLVNNYIINKYPIKDAFAMTIKQRDEYHKRWDTDKKETMQKFYKHYPQFSKYELKEEGFSWLWYYAMQQMGDDESKQEREAMYEKIKKREQLSAKIAQFFPPLQVQLSMNAIANTSLTHHIDFLDATTEFHEDLRLQFYPKVFEGNLSNSIDWENQKPIFYKGPSRFSIIKDTFYMFLIIVILIGLGGLKTIFTYYD